MNSEETKKHTQLLGDLMFEIFDNIKTTPSNLQNSKEYIASMIIKIQKMFSESCDQIELLQFIFQNKPQDVSEIYHLMNMFLVHKNTLKIFDQIQLTQHNQVFQEYSKLLLKCSQTFTNGMVAMKMYRNGMNIVNNTQNNTLNQVNINNNSKVQEIEKPDEKLRIKEQNEDKLELQKNLNEKLSIKEQK